MPHALKTRLYAETLLLAIQTITENKVKPIVKYFPDNHAEIFFTPADITFLKKLLEKLLTEKPKTAPEIDVRIHAIPILLPVIGKRLVAPVAGIALTGFIVGKTV